MNILCEKCFGISQHGHHGAATWVPAEKRSAEQKNFKKRVARIEAISFTIAASIFLLAVIAIYAAWIEYLDPEEAVAEVSYLYNNFRDVNIMIFFGFGFLMTFLRRYGYGAVGYTLFVSALVVIWSVLIECWFKQADDDFDTFDERQKIGVESLLDGLFTAGAVMISFGAILGKATPIQLLLMGIIEPLFYWLNIFICSFKLEALDVGGGMYIHTFGAYFGLALTFFLTERATRKSPDNIACYSSDLFSLAGTLFLWICWPSFNAVIATPGIFQLRAIVNTFLSLVGSTSAAFLMSRIVGGSKFDIVHIQNSTLAGGVCMGVIADLDIYPATAIVAGLIAGTISVLGYKWLTPFLNNRFYIQDVCGVHNLHGMPGVFGSIVGIIAIAGLSNDSDDDLATGHGDDAFPKGTDQAAIQLAALGTTIGLALLGGSITGFILWAARFIHPMFPEEFYNDRTFWHLPSDYERVVRLGEDETPANYTQKEKQEEEEDRGKSRGGTVIRGRDYKNSVEMKNLPSSPAGDDKDEDGDVHSSEGEEISAEELSTSEEEETKAKNDAKAKKDTKSKKKRKQAETEDEED